MHGRPLVGPSGMMLDESLRDNGLTRADVDLFNALACRPRGNNLKMLRSKLAARNRQRESEGLDRLPDPVDACRGRLIHELRTARAGRPHDQIITTGKVAYQALVPPPVDPETGHRSKHPSILKLNGTLYEGPLVALDGKSEGPYPVRIVPTVHPAYVIRKRSFTMPFYRAIDRFRRWTQNMLAWVPPRVVITPPMAELGAWEAWARSLDVLYYDTEATSLEPTWANLKTIQVGNGDHVVIFAIRDATGKRLVRGEAERAYLAWCERVLGDGATPVAGHNVGSYDKQVMQRVGIHVQLDFDTVILHRYCDPDLPHDLGFVGATYTDIPEWKSEGKGANDDETLHRYGALDVAANARAGAKLVDKSWRKWKETSAVVGGMKPLGAPRPLEGVPGAAWCRKIPPDPALFQDHQMQAVCVKLHQRGILIDQDARRAHEEVLLAAEEEWVEKVQEAVAVATNGQIPTGIEVKHKKNGTVERNPVFNPRSPDALRLLLYEHWDLPPPDHLSTKEIWTDSEERSTSDTLLRAYLADATLGADVHRALHTIRRAKKFRTLHGRFIKKLCLPHERPDDVDWIAVWNDGRVRVNWSVHTTGVGRLSSGGRPASLNMQTIPSMFRDCFIARPGYVLVGADLANVHLRIIANLWKIPSLLDDYLNDRDPHATLAEMVFGQAFLDAEGWPSEATNWEWKGPAKMMRGVAKALRYAGAYGAQVPTIHATMTRAEDKDGNLLHRTLTVGQVRAYYDAWMGKEPQWQQAWDVEVGYYRQHGFVLSPLLGRRADFTDGEDFNKLANFRILAGEADIMGPATVRVDNRLREMGIAEDAGLVGQFHDAMLLEVPEDRAEECRVMLEEEMTVRVPGWPVDIVADAKIGRRWKDVN